MSNCFERPKHQSREFVVVGIHLAGARSKRSGLVRGHFKANEVFSIAPEGLLQRLSRSYEKWFPGLELLRLSRERALAALSPLMVDAHVAQLGPEPERDADTVLFQAITDLGPADFYVFDAPLSLPPCTNCPLNCPGFQACRVQEVVAMNEMWQLTRLKGKKERAPQPYVDRYFDYFARHVLDERSRFAGLQFEASLGSNRAPLTARARYLVKRLHSLFPQAVFFETQSVVAAMSWGLHFLEHEAKAARGIKKPIEAGRPFGGSQDRQKVLAGLLRSGRLNFGASLDPQLKSEFCSSQEVFFAGMNALIPRSLAAAEIFFQDDLVDSIPDDVGFPLLPAAVGHYIDQSAALKGSHEPI